MNLPSRLIEDAVSEFEKLPGIGKKTALRLVLHLLKQQTEVTERFSETLLRMRKEVKYCQSCFTLCDADICSICANPKRNQQMICVVENIRDVIAIESTQQYFGVYHVLGGVINPIEGIGPEQLQIDSLVNRVQTVLAEEVIMALNPTIEGDTTIYYLSKKLQHLPVKITTLSRGVAFGAELEYTDDMTLARSIASRLPYENYLVQR
jgi:recombination protein RecR